jgi:hypothetical protein
MSAQVCWGEIPAQRSISGNFSPVQVKYRGDLSEIILMFWWRSGVLGRGSHFGPTFGRGTLKHQGFEQDVQSKILWWTVYLKLWNVTRSWLELSQWFQIGSPQIFLHRCTAVAAHHLYRGTKTINVTIRPVAGGCSNHNFLTSRVKWNINYLIAILTSRAITYWNPQLEPIWSTPLLGDLIKGGGLGAWSQKCMKCPQVGRGCVFKQITSNSKHAVHVLNYAQVAGMK